MEVVKISVSPSHPPVTRVRWNLPRKEAKYSLYITDDARKKTNRSGYYTAPELDRVCAEYFADCDANERRPTKPGLLIWLGVTDKEWKEWEEGGPGYSRHPAVCQKALLEMRDRLEQRTDTAAIFLLKQRAYGGYTDRPDAAGTGAIQVQVTFGNPNKSKGKK